MLNQLSCQRALYTTTTKDQKVKNSDLNPLDVTADSFYGKYLYSTVYQLSQIYSNLSIQPELI